MSVHTAGPLRALPVQPSCETPREAESGSLFPGLFGNLLPLSFVEEMFQGIQCGERMKSKFHTWNSHSRSSVIGSYRHGRTINCLRRGFLQLQKIINDLKLSRSDVTPQLPRKSTGMRSLHHSSINIDPIHSLCFIKRMNPRL